MDMVLAKNKKKILLSSLVLVALCLAVWTASRLSDPGVFASEVRAVLRKDKEISFDDGVTIAFSSPVRAKNVEDVIVIEPETDVSFEWSPDGKGLTMIPRGSWNPETSYTLVLPEESNGPFSKILGGELSFETQKHPRVVEIVPADDKKNVFLGAEDPIIVRFDKSAKEFFIKFELNPEENVAYQNNPEKTEFRILPKSGVKDGQKYVLELFSKRRGAGDGEYVPIYKSSFETAPAPPLEWSDDKEEKLAQARLSTRPSIKEGKYIDVNLSSQIMTIFENGELRNAFLVSSGKKGMDTPEGTFQIHNKAPRPWSKQYSLFMPHWMALTGDGKIGIHELPEWPGGFKEGASHLGTPVSHGCVRLGVGAAKEVYDWAEIGIPVIIHR